MRRADREIKNRDHIIDVLHKCDVVRLAFNTADYPYIVPMNFGAEDENGSLVLWFHCAQEGRRLDLIAQDARAGFEADCSHKLIEGENAYNYTMEYESIIGYGDIHVCGEKSEKVRGLTAIMRHYAPEKEFDFPDSVLEVVCVLRLDVRGMTGKRLMT